MLKRIHEAYYFCKWGGLLFSLKFNDYGILSHGRAWHLSFIPEAGGQNQHIATFVMLDDGYHCYESCYGGKLWKSIAEILPEANLMIRLMAENN